MDHPFLTGFIILAIVIAIGLAGERWRWAPAVAVVATVALIAEALLRAVQ